MSEKVKRPVLSLNVIGPMGEDTQEFEVGTNDEGGVSVRIGTLILKDNGFGKLELDVAALTEEIDSVLGVQRLETELIGFDNRGVKESQYGKIYPTIVAFGNGLNINAADPFDVYGPGESYISLSADDTVLISAPKIYLTGDLHVDGKIMQIHGDYQQYPGDHFPDDSSYSSDEDSSSSNEEPYPEDQTEYPDLVHAE